MREVPLEDRKRRLERIIRKSSDGIVFNEHLDSDGAAVFKHACKLGLEGIVSKRRDMRYRSGRSKSWLKIKTGRARRCCGLRTGRFELHALSARAAN
jgi:bifunctional non-homologous end joining protein LigD